MAAGFIQQRFDDYMAELSAKSAVDLASYIEAGGSYSGWQFDLVQTVISSSAPDSLKRSIAMQYAGCIDQHGFFSLRPGIQWKYSYPVGLRMLWEVDRTQYSRLAETICCIAKSTGALSVVPPTELHGLWTERRLWMALQGQLSAYQVTGCDYFRSRLMAYLSLAQQMITAEWGLLHNLLLHESSQDGDPDQVFSPWMSALVVDSLENLMEEIPGLGSQCEQLIVQLGTAIARHGIYQVNEGHPDFHPEIAGRWFPNYLLGPGGSYHDQNSWDNAHHALDVAAALASAYTFGGDESLHSAAVNLLRTAEWQLTVRWPNLPGGRQLNWNFAKRIVHKIADRVQYLNPTTTTTGQLTTTTTAVPITTTSGQVVTTTTASSEAKAPDWGPLDDAGMPTEAELVGDAPAGNPWLAAVFPGAIIAIDHSTANVSGQADLYERVDGTWQPPRTIVWPFGGHAPEVYQDVIDQYWIGEDRGHASYGEVYQRNGVLFEWQHVPDSPLQARARVVHGDPGLPWPEGVPQPAPGDWSAARFRYRFWDSADVELVNFCGDGSEPLVYVPSGASQPQSGFWLPTGNGMADLADGTQWEWGDPYPERRIWPTSRTPWHWDGWAEMVGHVLVLYSRHQPNSGVFWRDESGQWHEKCRTQWGHQLTVNWFRSRLISCEGRIDRVDIRDGKIFYAKGR